MLPCPNSPPRFGSRQSNAAELRAVDATNAVVLGQPLIQKSVVRVQQFEHAAVLAQDALEKQFGLAPESLPQALVKTGEDVRVGRERLRDF